MKPFAAVIVRIMNRIQDRFRRARAGSVLILVVALLVLMALLGTAFISTARIDRYGSAQNAFNTQIDLLVEGAKNLVVSAILGDLRDAAGEYRPPDVTPPAVSTYHHTDNYLVDLYLAARVPTAIPTSPGNPEWTTVGWPLIANGAAAGTYQFESPGTTVPFVLTPPIAPNPPKGGYTFRPTVALFAGDPNWPHLEVYQAGGASPVATVPAADVDGDGIADAGLWKLPISPIDGITYYVATRIIDNNSAWNGSIAWTPSVGADAFDIPGNSFFPSEIDLQRMFAGSNAQKQTAMDELNTYRTGNLTAQVLTDVYSDGAPTAQAAVSHDDFDWMNTREAMWSQLGRRLEYPGYKTGGATALRYQSVPFSASASLAYRFCLQNVYGTPSVFEQTANPNLILSYTTAGNPGVKTTPYAANLWLTWFTDNFDYVNPNKPLRALTVARNPVANARPSHSVQQSPVPPDPVAGRPGFRNDWQPGVDYIFGDWVHSTSGQAWLCIQPHRSTPAPSPNPTNPNMDPGDGTVARFWEPVPWTDQPLKASANAAGFGELWHAFWDVMAEVPPLPAPQYPTAPANPPVLTGMFRNASRDASIIDPLVLNNYQMLQLRSALAAVNTMDLRDSDNDVTSRNITLNLDPTNNGTAAATHNVTVFGTERQPYITEVLVDTGTYGGNAGYIAIELHNPYPYDIPLDNWRLVAVDRRPTATRPRTITDMLGGLGIGQLLLTIPPPPPASTSIPANGYVVIDSATTPAQRPADVQADLTARNIRPASAPGLIDALNGAFDREINLLRPRRGDGILTASVVPGNTYDEGVGGAPNFAQMVPVDQVDLTFVVTTVIGQRYNYRRGSTQPPGVSPAPWNFTQADTLGPAGYVLLPPINRPRHSGIITPGDIGNLGADDHALGSAPVNQAATYASLPMQIANADWGGPHKTMDPSTGAALPQPYHFPYGGFARNGDLLQIPFVGAYRIQLPGDDENSVREWNAVTMDALFADDGVPLNNPVAGDTGLVADAREQLGRFCPVGNPRTGTGDFGILPAGWTHHWAMDLFDHLTVQAPHDDNMPDVDPTPAVLAAQQAPTPDPAKYPGGPPADPVSPVANAKYNEANDYDATPANLTDPISPEGSKVPVEGLININTAPWKTLEALPLLPGGTPAQIRALAQAIVTYRDSRTGPVPFNTIYDLYKVPEFAQAQDDLLTAGEPNDLQGDFSPLGPAAGSVDGVRFDFEERFLLLNRISNFITTRSDSYTCYLLVQGWQDAGTANPTLKTQRRLAFIVDRSRINPANPQAAITPVPNN